MNLLFLLGLGICFAPWHQAESYKIIMFSVFGSQSHLNVFYKVGEALVEAGHEVSLLTPYPPRNSTNIKEIYFPAVTEKMNQDKDKMASMFLGSVVSESKRDTSSTWNILFKEFPKLCSSIISHEAIRDMINAGQQYDVAINNAFMNDCTMPIAVTVAKHLIQLASGELSSLTAYEMNVPHPYSVVTCKLLPYAGNLNFWQRGMNSLCHFGFYAMTQIMVYPTINNIIQEIYPSLPSIQEAKSKTSLVFTNRIAVTDGSIPMLPYVQEIGGINNVPAKELPKDFKAFIEGSGDAGFIYVALGSAIPEELLPEEKKLKFIEAFSKIPQRVIWKFKEKRTDLPPNVKTVKWAPQQDILGHPKCKAFISHGGHLSLDEAIYHEVPIIGMPIVGDQPANIVRAQYEGWALELLWQDLTAETLVEKLRELINNNRYKEKVKVLSKRMRDQPQTSKETALYWIEYVVRHNGAHHLRTTADNLNIFQYFLLDVIGTALLVLSITLYVIYKILKLVFCTLCSKKKSDKVIAKKQKTKKNK